MTTQDFHAAVSAIMAEIAGAYPEVAPWETVAAICKRHGLNDDQIRQAMDEACRMFSGVKH